MMTKLPVGERRLRTIRIHGPRTIKIGSEYFELDDGWYTVESLEELQVLPMDNGRYETTWTLVSIDWSTLAPSQREERARPKPRSLMRRFWDWLNSPL